MFAGGILVALLLTAIVGWVVVNSGDTVTADISDLAPDVVSVPYQDNAYAYLSRAAALLQWPRHKPGMEYHREEGWEWDDALAGEVLYRNSEVLSLVEQGLACSGYFAW